MDSSIKNKDNTCNSSATASVIASICSSDSFSIFPSHHHDLTSTNSIELNAAASLSDDSGVPLTTNSSISSGDSYRLGLCKFDIDIVESDGEVSQFDSLDNCSEGGMSAENFNTLKKGPLAPIDPPPEFQDSPQTTLVRSMSKNPVGSLRRWTSSQSSFEHLKDHGSVETNNLSIVTIGNVTGNAAITDNYMMGQDMPEKDIYTINKHLYSSDSILNGHMDNIYDEPNNILSSSLGNSVDILDSDSPSQTLPPPPPPVSIVKIKQTLCPYFQDHTRYFKAIPSEQDNITAAVQRFNVSGLSEIHDYDLYYGIKRNAYQQYDNSLQRKIIYSPLSNSHHCHNHIYHGGMCNNRPNSRNSLNSRLSSSHNSLSVSSANKPDDSIFITQAMSHDALLTREISDFYNVPIDSDIYALPVDMIKSEKERSQYIQRHSVVHASETASVDTKDVMITSSCSKHVLMKCHHQTKENRKNKNKRKKRSSSKCPENGENSDRAPSHISTSTSSRYTSSFVSTSSIQEDVNINTAEPLHMTLDEVKQFYHTLYSETKESSGDILGVGTSLLHSKAVNTNSTSKASNEVMWCGSTVRSRSSNSTLAQSRLEKSSTSNTKSNVFSQKNFSSDSETHAINNINNNNNMIAINNQNNQNQNTSQKSIACSVHDKDQPLQSTQSILKANIISSNEKKSQFTLNLKQRFCSIFRFRKNHSRYSTRSGDTNENEDNLASNEKTTSISKSNEDKRKKFQSRALPPLPKKESGEHTANTIEEKTNEMNEKKSENRSFHFTSSIEKVKDYGWYWGPLSSEAAEKVLSNEPDGSFIVRDSSDDHYIFSLSFKLNNCVRHVRIEQDQGTFSFGSYAKFKSQTITEFIEKAVEHSRSGRYLFFLHRRPEHGPMRVQLTNPVSRFKHVQSLQHMCRFVILKAVIRKDLIQTLPLPRRLLDYLNYKHCYSEQIESDSSNSQISGEGSL